MIYRFTKPERIRSKTAVFAFAQMILAIASGSSSAQTSYAPTNNSAHVERAGQPPASRETEIWETPIEDPTPPVDTNVQERSSSADVIVNQIAEADFEIARPDWIPEHAYSNDSMVSCFHNAETSQKSIPCEPQWIKLAPSVVQFWDGAKVEPFWVVTTVDQDHPGHFLFCSNYTGGPRGWLQKTKERSAWGNQEYRYWFDRK